MIIAIKNAHPDAEAIQRQLYGEVSAIEGYKQDAAGASDPQVKAKFLEIMREEEHHKAELEALLK